MVPSTESTLEGLICRKLEIFPVICAASDDHHSLTLLIGGLSRWGLSLLRRSNEGADRTYSAPRRDLRGQVLVHTYLSQTYF